ncbi:MAG: hypothetical protein ABR608_05365 [Pseudonocardiaceae bacterium]
MKLAEPYDDLLSTPSAQEARSADVGGDGSAGEEADPPQGRAADVA